jgi:hypothetical protein
MAQKDAVTFPLKLAYPFLEKNSLSSEMEKIRDSKEKLGSYFSSLKRAKVVALLQQKNLLELFIQEAWPVGSSPAGKNEIKRLVRIFAKYQNTEIPMETTDPEEELSAQNSAFAYEEHLRDYLAEHLDILEKGLKLWPVGPDEDAVEYPVDGRRIDILAQDSHGVPVVVELKVSKGHEKVVGQVLYYRAKIREVLNVKTARVFIVALKASEELRLAAKEVPDLSLFEYLLSMTVKQI